MSRICDASLWTWPQCWEALAIGLYRPLLTFTTLPLSVTWYLAVKGNVPERPADEVAPCKYCVNSLICFFFPTVAFLSQAFLSFAFSYYYKVFMDFPTFMLFPACAFIIVQAARLVFPKAWLLTGPPECLFLLLLYLDIKMF